MTPKEKTIVDAKAKYNWGEELSDVKRFLLSSKHVTVKEADKIICDFKREKLGPIIYEGVKASIFGLILVLIPIGFYLACLKSGFIPAKAFIILCVLGVYGMYKIVSGVFKIFNPKAEKPRRF